MLTKKQKRAARRACKVIPWLDEAMDCLCNDPMTEAMGAPVGDFYEDWSRRHRRMLTDCLDDPHNTPAVRRMLLDAFDRYLP